MIIRTCALAAALAALTATSGFAATVKLSVGGGQQMGTSNVEVNGKLFDVEFINGSCLALFDGCDAVSDFDFTNSADALAAAKSLNDTVFLDGPLGNFDSGYTLTNGIEANLIGLGIMAIPYAIESTRTNAAFFRNEAAFSKDLVGSNLRVGISVDLSANSIFTYARFTPAPISAVPLPAGGFLLLAGLAGLGAQQMRHRIAATD
ncbi:VPLPA-CTERM sorting domain-containing protein [uncultured Roseobacter sp.]|uniref:VPLPA-CTERM sorting domain-containing protein n=1 Tax=uncultured Roseobacter sp. TaxID=114847 RepID=UPI002635BC4A|nr:VPLPA-CTERM sorting domain-containing protein [uncultured Roseobacter sp.]